MHGHMLQVPGMSCRTVAIKRGHSNAHCAPGFGSKAMVYDLITPVQAAPAIVRNQKARYHVDSGQMMKGGSATRRFGVPVSCNPCSDGT